METNDEYHDPDYPNMPVSIKEEIITVEKDKTEKIKQIMRREFANELEVREKEVKLIDQRMTTARRFLHNIRYNLVNNYYAEQKLQLSSSQIEDDVAAQTEPRARAEVSSILREGQRRIHPSVLKLLGKRSVDIGEIISYKAPRNRAKKDYLAMTQTKNVTIAADKTTSLRPDKPPEATPHEHASTSQPQKVPRHIEPKVENIVTLDEITRNKMKNRYRIIIGNTSKYAPAASRADRSTHKWLLYVRGPPQRPDLAPLLTAAHVRLHPSYAPHHTVRIEKPPFHVSRRGWGEFPARVELHFPLPEVNRPAVVEHMIKLDRNYTGLQTLGAETLVDVWLYSTPEMLEYEYKEDAEKQTETPKVEVKVEVPTETEEPTQTEDLNSDRHTDSWLDFFSKDSTELNVDEMLVNDTNSVTVKKEMDSGALVNVASDSIFAKDKLHNGVEMYDRSSIENPTAELPSEILNKSPVKKRIMKYMDPATGKIYYLEMDRSLDLSKVQEIVINSKGHTKTAKISPMKGNGVKQKRRNSRMSLLKPEVKNQLKQENKTDRTIYSHIENDHCYLGSRWFSDNRTTQFKVPHHREGGALFDNLKAAVAKLTCVKVIVNYLLKNIPLISDEAADADYLKHFPFVAESEDKYWKLDFSKRRNIEWSRAKLINKMLLEKYKGDPSQVWRTKQILIYSRLHCFSPARPDNGLKREADWSSWNNLDSSSFDTDIKEMCHSVTDLCSLTTFNQHQYLPYTNTVDLLDSDEDVDIVNPIEKVKIKKDALGDTEGLIMLPVEKEEDRLRFMYIERKCADIGLELRVEDVGNGFSYSAVHAVLLSAMRSFAEELVRSALAVSLRLSRDAELLPTVWIGIARDGPRPAHVFAAARENPRLHMLTRRSLGTLPPTSHAI